MVVGEKCLVVVGGRGQWIQGATEEHLPGSDIFMLLFYFDPVSVQAV